MTIFQRKICAGHKVSICILVITKHKISWSAISILFETLALHPITTNYRQNSIYIKRMKGVMTKCLTIGVQEMVEEWENDACGTSNHGKGL